VIRHRCDGASCHRPSHRVTGPATDSAADFTARKGAGIAAGGPQRARPGATSILAGLHRGDGQERIEAAIWPASAARVSGDQARLFDWPPAGLGGRAADREFRCPHQRNPCGTDPLTAP